MHPTMFRIQLKIALNAGQFVMLICVTIYYFKLIHVINKILHFVLQCNQDEIMDDAYLQPIYSDSSDED